MVLTPARSCDGFSAIPAVGPTTADSSAQPMILTLPEESLSDENYPALLNVL